MTHLNPKEALLTSIPNFLTRLNYLFPEAFNNNNSISKKRILFERFGKDKIFLYASILAFGAIAGSGFFFYDGFQKEKGLSITLKPSGLFFLGVILTATVTTAIFLTIYCKRQRNFFVVLAEMKNIVYKNQNLWNDPMTSRNPPLNEETTNKYLKMTQTTEKLLCELHQSMSSPEKDLGQLNDLRYSVKHSFMKFMGEFNVGNADNLKKDLQGLSRAPNPKIHIFTSSSLFTDIVCQRQIKPA